MDSLPQGFISTKTKEKEEDSLQAELEKYKRPLIPQDSFEKPQLKTFQSMQSSEFVGPARPDTIEESSSSSDDEIDMSYQQDNPLSLEEQRVRELAKQLPCSHEVLLRGHSKTVTTIDCDAKGIRLITGGNDYDVRMWDFTGMNNSMNSFRIIEPSEGHPVRTVSWSPNSTQFLVCTGSAKPKVFNRDGKELFECIKGDMYISDLTHTRGHTQMVKSGQWSPVDNNVFMTCSLDSTVRLWDVTSKLMGVEQQLAHKVVMKCKSAKGVKVGCSTCRYSADGRMIAVGCDDGSIHIYNARNHFSRAEISFQNAHTTDITSLHFFIDGQSFLSRSTG